MQYGYTPDTIGGIEKYAQLRYMHVHSAALVGGGYTFEHTPGRDPASRPGGVVHAWVGQNV